MKTSTQMYKTTLAFLFLLIFHQGFSQEMVPYMEMLDRGLVAIKTTENQVFISWRSLANDPEGATFDIYRNEAKLNNSPISDVTSYTDEYMAGAVYYIIRNAPGFTPWKSKTVEIWEDGYLRVRLLKPSDGEDYTYEPNDASIADLDNDGQYEIVLKWQPTNAKDNSQAGFTGNTIIDAYEFDGIPRWRIDLGKNIRSGAHYTQFLVYDFESDGYPELVCKTADGTVDGLGNVIGDASADYRNSNGYILDGPEYLTVFDGLDGSEKVTTNYYPARGNVGDWGDTYGNRVDRFLAGVAYFDGERPSILMTRGYYTRTVLAAYDYRNGELTERWVFDTNHGYGNYTGKGNHSLSIADLDDDGKDEVIFGAMAIDDDGTPLHNTTWGHGDALHVSDFNPARPGLEIFMPVEWSSQNPDNQRPGLTFRDGATGALIWGAYPDGEDVDVGRGVCGDINPATVGAEVWGAKNLGMYNMNGTYAGALPSSINFLIWWDGDLSRELLDRNEISKYGEGLLLRADGAVSNNGTKATPVLSADIFGDWREEVILREEDNRYLRVYSTTIPTDVKMPTLMHDKQYREAIAWQNVGYNQPPHTSFYFGSEMQIPKPPNIQFPESSENPNIPVLKVNDQSQGINLYPNPVLINGKVYIDKKTNTKMEYIISEPTGSQIVSGKVTEYIDLSNLSAGIYLIQFYEAKRMIGSRKIVVN
jgi:hypothetical protein